MSERPYCRCPLCRMETQLLADLENSAWAERCRAALQRVPALAPFADFSPLLTHLKYSRDKTSTDPILRALLDEKHNLPDGIADRILLLAFLPQMHAALTAVQRRYPQLSAEDGSQNVLHVLLRFLDSKPLRLRKDFLGFAIARRVKRAAFEWAEHELRSSAFFDNGFEIHNSTESIERLALLRHFLDRAWRRGELTAEELDLLIDFKLENGTRDDGPSNSNAHRQRLKRLLQKLRRLAADPRARPKHH
jgi:hypothetical protein